MSIPAVAMPANLLAVSLNVPKGDNLMNCNCFENLITPTGFGMLIVKTHQ